MSLIKLNNVSKSYLNKSFDITITKNEKILIIGVNGSGKSTLIKLITRYIRPSNGSVINTFKNISYLEEVVKLPLQMKVLDYINLMLKIKNTSLNYELFNVFKIPDNKYIYELSKGNKQKLALLVTLSSDSDLIVLDEPLNGLDSNIVVSFVKYLKKVNKTLIIVTHFPNDYNILGVRRINLWQK